MGKVASIYTVSGFFEGFIILILVIMFEFPLIDINDIINLERCEDYAPYNFTV